jgi:basic membrane protein A
LRRQRRGANAVQVGLAVLVIVIIVAAAAYWAYTSRGGSPGTSATTGPATTGSTTTAGAAKPGSNVKVLVLFDVGGKGDLSFNDMAVLGAERAKKDFGVQVDYQTPRSTDEMESLLRSVSKGDKYDLIIGVGFLWLDAMSKVAPQFPNQKYALIDAAPQKPISNLAAYVFREQEVAALVGILAADIAHHIGCDKAGAVAGMDIPPLWRFHIGYLYGIQYYNQKTGSNVSLVWTYTGTFGDPQTGKQTTQQMIAQGVCAFYGLAGLTHIGMFDAVREAAEQGHNVIAIGEDASQEWYDPYHIILSGLKRVDVAVYDAIKSVVYGNFTGGIHSLGIKEGALGISDDKIIKYFADIAAQQGKLPKGLKPDDVVRIVEEKRSEYISDKAWQLVDQLKSDIVSGRITFISPSTHDEYQSIIDQLKAGNLQAALAQGKG